MATTNIPWEATIGRRSDLSTQELDGDLVMADIQAGQFFGLGSTARSVWELLESPTTPSQICSSLGDRYEVDQEDCERDVQEFLSELLEAGLILIEE